MDNTKKPVMSARPYAVAEAHRALTHFGEPTRDVVEPVVSNSLVGPVLDLKRAAALLQCHPKTLRLMAQAKKVPARRVGKLWRFSAQRLKEWLEASE